MRNVPKALKAARLWVRALDEASKGREQDALLSLRAIAEVKKVEVPSGQLPYEVNLLCAHAACNLNDPDLCAQATVVALRQLTQDEVAGLSSLDKDYLRYYCKRLLEYCASNGRTVDISNEIVKPNLTYGSLQIEKVKRHLRENFPIIKPSAAGGLYPEQR